MTSHDEGVVLLFSIANTSVYIYRCICFNVRNTC